MSVLVRRAALWTLQGDVSTGIADLCEAQTVEIREASESEVAVPVLEPARQAERQRSAKRSVIGWSVGAALWLCLLLASVLGHRASSLVLMSALFLVGSLAQVLYSARRFRQAGRL